MWCCPKCNSNLLDIVSECPVCKLPGESAELLKHEPSMNAASHANATHGKTLVWVMLGLLIPPLGVAMLLMLLAQKMTPKKDA